MTDFETGKCTYCESECNPLSQTCGTCARLLTGYTLGWNELPLYLQGVYKNLETNKIIVKSSIPIPSLTDMPREEFFRRQKIDLETEAIVCPCVFYRGYKMPAGVWCEQCMGPKK